MLLAAGLALAAGWAGPVRAEGRSGEEEAPGSPRVMYTAAGRVEYVQVLTMEASAYYPGPESTGPWADGFTSIGLRAGHGIVAVDPEVIPLGTFVYIPDYGVAVAADVGSAIKGRRIDLCFDTYREAVQFGRRSVQVYILTPEWAHQEGRHIFPAEVMGTLMAKGSG